MSELRRVCHDWRQSGIRGMNGVSQARQDAEAKAVTTCVRHRQTTSRHDHAVSLDRLSPILLQLPAGIGSTQSDDEGIRPELNPVSPGQSQEAISHIPGAIRGRKELGGFLFLYQREAELLLEERD